MRVPQTIVVFRVGSLGDTVVALPALHRIRRLEPEAKIVLLTNFPVDGGVKAASSYQVLSGSGLVDDFIEYRPPQRFTDGLSLVRSLHRLKARRVYYLMPRRSFSQRLRDRLFFAAAGFASVRGLAISRRFERRGRVSNGVNWESESLRLLRMVGGGQDELIRGNFDLVLLESERDRAREVLRPLHGCRYLIVSLGTKVPVKDWGDDNWKSALSALSAELPGVALVLIGSADEFARCSHLSAQWSGPVLNLCGALTPRESGAVASGALLFIGHDSGPAHLAAAVGTRVVTIHASRDLPGVWFPFGNEEHAFYERTDCFNCRLDVCIDQKMRCIRSISPRRVVSKVLSLLADDKNNSLSVVG